MEENHSARESRQGEIMAEWGYGGNRHKGSSKLR